MLGRRRVNAIERKPLYDRRYEVIGGDRSIERAWRADPIGQFKPKEPNHVTDQGQCSTRTEQPRRRS